MVSEAIRVQQDNSMAVSFGVAAALLLDQVVQVCGHIGRFQRLEKIEVYRAF